MNGRRVSSSPSLFVGLLSALLLLSACARDPGNCLPQDPADISHIPPYTENNTAPFRFPLDDLTASQKRPSARFQDSGLETPTRREYHAAEDYLSPPGTPVYAIAGGQVSFSGRMGGYGWLVIVDHPRANLYSLYGHLSPSRWQIEEGPVSKGDLLGYLGDPDENGGTAEQPLRPHLHLGLRAGQRNDYPGTAEWRWQAGWISPCPSDLGWLQPSAILTAQEVPAGGFPKPAGRLFEVWGVELVLAAIYLVGGVSIFIYSLRRDKPSVCIGYGVMMLVAGIVLSSKDFRIAPLMFVIAALSLAAGIFLRFGRSRRNADPTHHP